MLNNDESYNYKLQAIYSGLRHCDEVSQIKELLRSVQDAERTISLYFPGIGTAINKIFFNIDYTARLTFSIRFHIDNLSAKFDPNDAQNTNFIQAVSKATSTESPELYFKDLAIYIARVVGASLKQRAFGQQTIDMSLNMLSLSCNTFGELSLGWLARISRRENRLSKKAEEHDETNGVKGAMRILKTYEKLYQKTDWDEMKKCSKQIIESLESND